MFFTVIFTVIFFIPFSDGQSTETFSSVSPQQPPTYKVAVQKFSDGPIISKTLNNSIWNINVNPTMFLYDNKIWLFVNVGLGYIGLAQIEIDSKDGHLNLIKKIDDEDFAYNTYEYMILTYPYVSQYNELYYRFTNTQDLPFCVELETSTDPSNSTSWKQLTEDSTCEDIDENYESCVGLFANENTNSLSQDYIICSDMTSFHEGYDNTSIRILSGNGKNLTFGSNLGGFDKLLIAPSSDVLAVKPGPAPLPLKDGNFLYLYNAVTEIIDLDTSSRLGYAILDGHDPSKVLLQYDQHFSNSIMGSNGYFYGLIPDPNNCKFVQASTLLGPNFENTAECFFGVYSGDEGNETDVYRSVYGFYIMIGTFSEVTTTTSTTLSTTSSKTSVTSSTTGTSTSTTSTSPAKTKAALKAWYFIVGGVILLIIVIGIIVIFVKRRNLKKEKALSNLQALSSLSAVENSFLNEFQQKYGPELNPSDIFINFTNIFGKGVSSTVYKGYIKTTKGTENIVVKVLTENSTEFIENELHILTILPSHPSIVHFYGWCVISDTPGIVTELAISDLFTYISSIKFGELSIKNIIKMLYQISVALEHLTSHGIIHRDIACRNILLFDNFVVKLSDFGLSCDQNNSIPQQKIRKQFPIKWLSPEAIISQLFSEKSDVWAFGICIFEIFSYGEVPYSRLDSPELLEFLQSGNRLQKPDETPDAIYELMLDCWQKDPQERPTFSMISKKLKLMLEYSTVQYGYMALSNE